MHFGLSNNLFISVWELNYKRKALVLYINSQIIKEVEKISTILISKTAKRSRKALKESVNFLKKCCLNFFTWFYPYCTAHHFYKLVINFSRSKIAVISKYKYDNISDLQMLNESLIVSKDRGTWWAFPVMFSYCLYTTSDLKINWDEPYCVLILFIDPHKMPHKKYIETYTLIHHKDYIYDKQAKIHIRYSTNMVCQ